MERREANVHVFFRGARECVDVWGNVRQSGSSKFNFVLKFERHEIVRQGIHMVDGPGVPPGNGGKGAILQSLLDDFAPQQYSLIHSGLVADTKLVRDLLESRDRARVKYSQQSALPALVQDSNPTSNLRESPFLLPGQNVESGRRMTTRIIAVTAKETWL